MENFNKETIEQTIKMCMSCNNGHVDAEMLSLALIAIAQSIVYLADKIDNK
jgi:hypothetical protein